LNSWTWLTLALLGADLAAFPRKDRYSKPLFHISGEVFKPAQGSHIDLHMLAMFFHDRHIERNLVKRIWTTRDLVELEEGGILRSEGTGRSVRCVLYR
jgi:hypothetical protein